MPSTLRNLSFGVPATKRLGFSTIVNAAWRFSGAGMQEWEVCRVEAVQSVESFNIVASPRRNEDSIPQERVEPGKELVM
ncbi:MAG: hypothetical protein ACREXR_15065 [Gammaproteobacteria bacterium]